ncbi:apomucin [Triplophysa dalaica]|uniref:apomucin n=1 Tax=Triplophysa dalaica TaxID=1582913 RepID=UPI0024DFE513|nr:apomucin [Triplophysa dalaica]
MLSRNLVIASVAVVFLASTVSTAPVEDKEPEENDFEAEEGEEELSEEEEDDDDSKAQHMKGAGSQQATSAPKGSGLSPSPGSSVLGESPNGHKLNGASQTGQVSLSSMSSSSEGSSGSSGRDGYSRPSASSSHGSSNNGQEGSKSEIASPAGGTGAHGALASKVSGPDGAVHTISVVSSGQGSSGHISAGHVIGRPSAGQTSGASAAVFSEVHSQPSGSEVTVEHTEGYENGDSAHETSQIESPETPETESNGNGHKHLMNGGETGFTGLDHFLPDTSQIQATGTIDQSNHDFLVGLMGGLGEEFGPDAHTAGLDQTTLQVDPTAAGSDPGHPSSGGSVLDVPPDPAGAASPSADYGNNDFAHSISLSDNGSPADTTDSSLISDTLKHPGHYFTDYTDGGVDNGADAPDTKGNGRHKPVVEIHKVGVVDHTLSPYADNTGQDSVTGVSAQTDLAGVAGELATDGHVQTDTMDRGHLAVTDGFPKHTDVSCVSEKQILCTRLALDLQMSHRHIVMWFRQIYRPQEIHLLFPHRQMSWAQLQLNLKGLTEVQQATLVLRNRHRQLYQQVNSTTHLVRVLKVQKMWNWKIPADFHMKPRVKFLRYRFQCIDQNAWQRNRQPAR